ncbi:hypothetical protein [Spirulina major]|uniref:hypothetical protein n=1 Tax=Spirulina major TaxID=270636 RepID=UPI0009331EA9|nr:hypothetical protein [Spirulina major]
MSNTVTIDIPEHTYARLIQIAQATRKTLTDVILRALEIGSPPDWQDVPADYQPDVAALDRLSDDELWRIARSQKPSETMTRYDDLLIANQDRDLTGAEQQELQTLRLESERFMLCKAQVIALLRWRGHSVLDIGLESLGVS